MTAAGLVLGVFSLGAQTPSRAQVRDGEWFSLGFGGANSGIACSGCIFTTSGDPWRGGFGSSGYLTFGRALSEQLLLGVEASLSGSAGDQRSATTTLLLFVMQYYPAAFKGFHLKGGVGASALYLSGEQTYVAANGAAVQLGTGRDFRVSRRFFIKPYANIARIMVHQGSLEQANNPGVTKLENRLLTQFGVGVTRYKGSGSQQSDSTVPRPTHQMPRGPQRHDGFNIGFGLGGAHYDLTCTGCATTGAADPWNGGLGTGFYFRLGGAVSQQLLLGGELGGGSIRGTDRRTSDVSQVLFTVQYYPRASIGLHVTGGMGLAAISLEDRDAGTVDALGSALRAGIGYDFGRGRRLAFTPYANIGRTMVSQGSIVIAGTPGVVTRIESRMLVQFGVGFNWY